MLGKPNFVSVDDYNNYWGEDLRSMLKPNSNVSNQAESFLYRAERRLMVWINTNCFRHTNYNKLSKVQLESLKEAILIQAKYMFKNGDLGLDSGYDQERGKVVEQAELNAISVSQAAIDVLISGGLFSMVMKNRPRANRGLTGNIDYDDIYPGY